jgi:hypothetical protein
MKIAKSLVVAVLVILAGCSASGDATRVNESPAAGSTEPAPSPRTGDRSTPTPPATAGADPEQPRDLVGPPITIAGTVRIVGGCTLLDTGSQRWALLGAEATQLRGGSRVTVRGRLARVPAGCQADRALEVSAAP